MLHEAASTFGSYFPSSNSFPFSLHINIIHYSQPIMIHLLKPSLYRETCAGS
jgi:hypothetical protein